MDALVQAATFENMKAHADRFAPSGGKGFFKSDADFFARGTHGQWRGVLTEEELAGYEAVMRAALGEEERAWLEFGAVGK